MKYVQGMNDVNLAKHGNNSSYYAPTSAPPAAAYPNAFQSGEIDSRLARNNTNNINRVNNVDTLMDDMNGNNHWATAAPPDPGGPSGLHIGEIDLNSTRNRTNTMSNPKGVAYTNTAKNGDKGRSGSPKTAPAVAGYPSAFHSAEIGSSSTLSNIQNGVYDTNNMTNATSAYKGNRGNDNSSTATQAIAGYPSVFPSTRVDSSSDSTNIVHNTNVANNRKKTDYHSKVAPPITMRSGDFEFGEVDLNSNSNRTNTVGNLNNMTHARIVENGEKRRCRSPTESLAVAEYPNSFQSGKIDSSSTAWEEHIDENTNRKFFYNCITGMSTWGKPNAMVKTPPPPPPSLPLASPIVEKREQDHWFKIRDNRGMKLWYNEITNMSQVDRPDCLRKYK